MCNPGAMSTQTPSAALLRLGWVAAIIYLGFGLVFGFLPSHWDEASLTDQVLYIVFLVGGALLLVAGLRLFSRSPGVGAVLVSIGGLAGAAPLFWTLLLPLVAIALIVLSVRDVRRARATAAA
jgi:hypothetical protein